VLPGRATQARIRSATTSPHSRIRSVASISARSDHRRSFRWLGDALVTDGTTWTRETEFLATRVG
jgi:hypothetical protein